MCKDGANEIEMESGVNSRRWCMQKRTRETTKERRERRSEVPVSGYRTTAVVSSEHVEAQEVELEKGEA